MLTIVDKPLIQYAVEEAVACGIDHVVLVTGRAKTVTEDHFDVSFELERTLEERRKPDLLAIARQVADLATVVMVRQKRPLGLGHAIGVARPIAGDQPFAVILPDDLMDAETPAIRQLLDAYERFSAPVLGVIEVDGPNISRFGVVRGDEIEPGLFRVDRLVEKPPFEEAPSNLAIMGRYVLTPDLFECIAETGADTRGEIQLTDALHRLLERRPIYARKLEGTRFDAGDKLGYLTATVEYALKHPELGEAFRAYLVRRFGG
jgi:UTP--glucose-1-phosphate uridylyltransferase